MFMDLVREHSITMQQQIQIFLIFSRGSNTLGVKKAWGESKAAANLPWDFLLGLFFALNTRLA
jgi:hypothetical protein